MCVSKAEAKQRLLVWAEWMNNNEGMSGRGHNLGFSSDGKMDPDYVATAGCRGSGMKVDTSIDVRPDYVEEVALALNKLDKVYQAYAFTFFRWKLRNRAGLSDCIEQFCNKDYQYTAAQYRKVSDLFYAKVCALFG